MARLLRKAWVWGGPVWALVILGCAAGPRGDVRFENDGPGQAPAGPGPRVARLQHPEPAAAKPADPLVVPASAINAAVPDKVRICAWVNGSPIFRGELLNEAARDLVKIQGTPEPDYSARRQKIL